MANYEIKTWICHVRTIGQRWNWRQSFQPLVMLLKVNDDKSDTPQERKVLAVEVSFLSAEGAKAVLRVM